MKITVKLFASLRIGRFSEEVHDYPEGLSVGDVLGALDIVEKGGLIMLRNGRRTTAGELLREGDVLALLPPISGG